MLYFDISHNNGTIQWDKIDGNKPIPDGAFIKATQGIGYTDPLFLNNAKDAAANGISAGYYHFCTLNEINVKQDAINEAEYFISVIKKAPIPTLPLALDIEVTDPKIQLDKVAVLKWVKTFFQTLEVNGYKDYIIYSYASFLDSHLPKDHGLGNIRLWLAAYTSKPTPVLPQGWADFWAWQYTDKGKLIGISTFVDLSRTH